jgi:D-alanyl-D-alanine carboxypeptidase
LPQAYKIMDKIDEILLEQVNANRTPSVAYYLFDQDRIIKKASYGLADIKTNKQVDEQTTYNAFSVTKTFTALAVLQLADEKKLDINKPIKNYLPEFPYADKITVKQVLSHSAGIPNPIPLNWIHLESEHSKFNRNIFFKKIFEKHSKVKSKPNEIFAYTNLGYFILGQLIEKVSKQSYERYITENIINKIGLDRSEMSFEITAQHATGYNKRVSFANFIIGFFVDKSKYMKPSEGKWKPYTYFYPNGASYGGLIGKPIGFVKYIQELLKDDIRIISEDYKKLLFQENYTNNGKSTGMCLAWFTGMLKGIRYFTHAGGGGGYYCELRIYPDKGLGSVIFFNRTGMSDARFLDRLDKIYFEFK